MIAKTLHISLPYPWQGKSFNSKSIAPINFLVGPNGSGKSRFASALKKALPGSRMLGTDRLSGMEQSNAFRSLFGDHLGTGFQKSRFAHFKNAADEGSGLDAIVLLEERVDLRIQVEGTLSHLFGRYITLEWDSGNLVPKASLGPSGTTYRLDRDECHGIKELLVLLTHLYNPDNWCLIIDEPELNLHPQYQAFFMQEVRRVAGDSGADPKKKTIFLITHSPFILDFQTVDDMKAVISFDLSHSVPRTLADIDEPTTKRLASLVPRINVYHKQLFFSDNPIFVEGLFDAQIICAIQDARKVSIAAAGSCVIDAGGCEEVTRYLELCSALGKSACFVYDMDSLFGSGNLRSCIRADGSLQYFLAAAGVGNDFGKYCGELDGRLTDAIDRVGQAKTVPAAVTRLVEFLNNLGPRTGWDSRKYAKARVAILTAMSRCPTEMTEVLSEALVSDVEGRRAKIVEALKQKRVFLLPGGTIERYLPSYAGDHYEVTDEAKKQAVAAECELLAATPTPAALAARYGTLYDIVCSLPAKQEVDLERVLRKYLGRYIHDLQACISGKSSVVSQSGATIHKDGSGISERRLRCHWAPARRGRGGIFCGGVDHGNAGQRTADGYCHE